MRSLNILALLSLLAFTAADEADVLIFTDADFDTKVSDHDTVLIMFYAPWCGHCKKLKPEFAKAATSLKNNDPPVYLAKIDCTEEGKETCSRFSVSGYPTLKIFRGGEVSQDYSGPREAGGIVKYMKAQVGPSSKELKTPAEVEDFISKEDVVISGFFPDDSSLKSVYLKLADKLRETARFAHATQPEIISKYDKK